MIQRTIEINRTDIFRMRLAYLHESRLSYLFISAFLFCLTCLIPETVFSNNPIFRIFSFLMVLVFPLYFLLLYFIAGRILKETVFFQHPITYSFDKGHLNVEGYNISTSIYWPDFYNWIEDEYAYYLFISSVQVFLIPKRFFEDRELFEISNVFKMVLYRKKMIFLRILSYIFAAFFIFSAVTNILVFLI